MRHPTMEDVAREAGVSRALVSLVFRRSPRVADTSRARVFAAAERLGYRPNAMARGLASRTERTVGVFIDDLHNPFFADLVDGIEEVAEREGLRILLGHGPQRGRESTALESLLEFRPVGLVLLSPGLPTRTIAERTKGIPVVVAGRRVRAAGVDSVLGDDVAGAALAVEYLAGLGHRRIAHVGGGGAAGGASRRRGYERMMRALGLGDHIDHLATGSTERAGLDAGGRLVDRGSTTAVFVFNDLVGTGLMSALDGRGVKVPDDVSVVGYDNSVLARARHIGLTTVDQPRREIGRRAMTRLLERISGDRATSVVDTMSPALVVRASTAPPPPAAPKAATRIRTTRRRDQGARRLHQDIRGSRGPRPRSG